MDEEKEEKMAQAVDLADNPGIVGLWNLFYWTADVKSQRHRYL